MIFTFLILLTPIIFIRLKMGFKIFFSALFFEKQCWTNLGCYCWTNLRLLLFGPFYLLFVFFSFFACTWIGELGLGHMGRFIELSSYINETKDFQILRFHSRLNHISLMLSCFDCFLSFTIFWFLSLLIFFLFHFLLLG